MTSILKERLQQRIENALGEPLGDLQIHQSCPSTNQLCQRQATHKSVFIAEEQTAGRGRRGKNWLSPRGENIYCSVGLVKQLPGDSAGLLPLQVGVSLAAALHQAGYSQVRLKWPNDLVVGKQKLGGILIESRPLSNNSFFLTIGFGLNVSLVQLELTSIDQPAVSLAQLSEKVPQREDLLVAIIAGVISDALLFDANSPERLLTDYAALDQLQGREVQVSTQKETLLGRYGGIQADGQMLLYGRHGSSSFSAAEVSLRPAGEKTYAAD